MDIDPDKFVLVFPCFAITSSSGNGIVTQPLDDGVIAIVLFTDADLCARYREEHSMPGAPIPINSATELALFLDDLPSAITRAAIDPKTGAAYCPTIQRIQQIVLDNLP